MTDRISALYVDLYQVTPDVDFDLYVVDEDDEIVARSTDTGTSDESIVLLPEVSNYRFEPGSKYTVLVHGQNLKVGTMVLPTANVRLEVGWDVLNMWLTKDGEQASDIGTGEAVSVTVNFEDRTMVQDLGCVQGYLTAGPHDFALLYEKVNACYVSEPPPVVPAWDPDNLTVEYTVETDRGPSPFAPWTIGGVDVPTALGRNWDRAVWTLQVTNNDPTFATPNIDLNADVTDYFGRLDPEFDGFVITPTVGSHGYNPMGPWGQVITWTGSLTVGESFTMSWASIMDPDMAMSDDHLSGVYDGGTLPYFEGACVYFRSFRTTGSEKMADPSLVYPGDTVNYTIALMNPSAEDRNVFVSDELDPALEFVSATNGATYDAANHRVTWGGPLNGSSIMSQTFDIEVTVADTALVGYISNCADVFTKLDDDYVGSYCDSVYVQPSAQVTIDKEVDDIDALGGDTLAYSIVMQNAGPLTATEAILTDMIPMYLTVITDSLWIDQGAGTAMLPADAYDEDDGLLSWEGDLGAGDTYTITFQATITDSAPVEWAIINAAEFTADNAMWKYDSALTEVVGLLSVYMPVVLRGS
jgi:uncharacterized repeat protein (TIGR01451 family)